MLKGWPPPRGGGQLFASNEKTTGQLETNTLCSLKICETNNDDDRVLYSIDNERTVAS